MDNTAYDKHAEQVGLDRYAVIAPLVNRKLTPGQYRDEKVRILGVQHKFPDGERWITERTLRRWLEWYNKGHRNEKRELVCPPGPEALRSLSRKDRGTTRVLSPEIIDRCASVPRSRRGIPRR